MRTPMVMGDAVAGLARAVLADPWARAALLALLAVDAAYVAAVLAKTAGLVDFDAGLGNDLIAAQLSVAALVVAGGWWRRREPAFASLAAVAVTLAADKIAKLHNLVGAAVAAPLLPAGLDDAVVRGVGVLVFAALLALVFVLLLRFGWRLSAPATRPALLLLAAGFAFVAAVALGADLLGGLAQRWLGGGQGALSRLEQGAELLTASALVALTVGVVRNGGAPSTCSGPRI